MTCHGVQLFMDALLSSETGFPNCKIGIGLPDPGADYSYLVNSSMGIFRKSINTLNLAMIKTLIKQMLHVLLMAYIQKRGQTDIIAKFAHG